MESSLPGIRNLLFDLGGVIIDLDQQRCVNALVALGDTQAKELLGLYGQQGEFMKLEAGEISAAEFLAFMHRRVDQEVPDCKIVEAINAFLVGIPVERLQLLRRLRSRYRVMMLSNTNSIMFDTKIADCFAQEGLTVEDYFDDIFLSYRLKACTPGFEIFERMVASSHIVPQETLFFDDTQKIQETAEALGFRTHLVTPGCDITSFFNSCQ